MSNYTKMKKSLIFLIFFSLKLLFSSELDTLFILQTNDIHGNLLPYDYIADESVNRGLAVAYSKICEYRKKHSNVILLDAGDLIQGTPLTYYYNRLDINSPHPMIEACNYMKYDALAVGNHDIEQGYFTYQRLRNQSTFPWLSANAIMEDNSTFFEPYKIIDRNDLKIGIIGLSTTGIEIYLDRTLYPGVDWKNQVETAKKYASLLRPQVDVLVGLFHSGFDMNDGLEVSKKMNLPIQNAAQIIADQIHEFDVVIGGHTHEVVPQKFSKSIEVKGDTKDKPICLMAGKWGNYLGVAQIIFDKKHKQIITKDGWLEPLKDVKPSKGMTSLFEPYHQNVLNYIRTPIGKTETPIVGKHAMIMDTNLLELIHAAQLDLTNANVSFASCFRTDVTIPPGSIDISDIHSIYPYENYLYVIELSGKQIKDYLEFSAEYFLLQDGKVKSDPNKKGYNYDMAEGISYKIEVNQRKGNRVKNLLEKDSNKPLDFKKLYKVAMNSYRALGGGGHIAASQAQKAPILFKSKDDMRTILIKFIQNKNTINLSPDHNWSLTLSDRKTE